MKRKLPSDAFTFYVSLGPERSYGAVAKHFHVDKRTVLRHASAQKWQAQLAEIEKKAQAKTQERLVSTLDEMNDRHLKVLRAVLGKALEALRATPLRSASDAVRAIDICVRHERVILGEPSDRNAVDIESISRAEYARWTARESDADDERKSSKRKPSGERGSPSIEGAPLSDESIVLEGHGPLDQRETEDVDEEDEEEDDGR